MNTNIENINTDDKELLAVFDNAAVVLILIDEAGRVIRINKPGSKMIKMKNHEAVGRLAGDVLNCVTVSRDEKICGLGDKCKSCFVRNTFTNTFRTGKPHYKKEGIFHIFADNKVVQLDLQISSSILKISDKPYILLTIDDITRQKTQERELKQLITTRDKLYSVIAHDLRNNLGAIKNFSDLLAIDAEDDDKERTAQYIDLISSSANSAHLLLENLFEWTSSQWYDNNVNRGEIEIGSFINEVVEMSKPMAFGKDITLVNKFNDSSSGDFDKNMIKTVLRNLINNAVKFSNRGGNITINAKKKRNYVQFSVEDNGVGISKDKIKHIFAKSNNRSTIGTEREKGTGLGLLICKEFVEKHGGKIWVESEEGEGATFYFTVKRA